MATNGNKPDEAKRFTHMTPKERELFSKIEREKQFYEDATQELRDEWEEIWKIRTQYVDKQKNPYNSSKRLPKAERAVNTLAAFLVAREPTFNVLPKGAGDDIKAQITKELLQHQAAQPNKLNLARNAKVIVKSAAWFGNGIAKVTWVTKLDPKTKKVLFDDPVMEAKHIMDMFVNPYISDFDQQVSVIERYVLPLEQVRNDKAYDVPKDMKPTWTDTTTSHRDSSRFDQYDLTISQGDGETTGMVELWEYWSHEWVYTIADPEGQPAFIRTMKNPYGFIPYEKMDYEEQPVPNRFYATGAIGPNVKVNKSIDETINNIIDNIRIIINPMYKRIRGTNVDPRQLISRPGGYIDVDNPSDIDQFVTQDTTASGFQLYNLLNAEFQAGTSVAPIRQGLIGGADTATEAEIQQQNADVTTNAVKKNFEEMLARIGIKTAKLNVQNIQTTHSLRIFNMELVNALNEMVSEIVFTQEELREVEKTGLWRGLMLTEAEKREALETGKLKGVPLNSEQADKLKKFGKIIKFAPEFIDADVDIDVEADSTLNQDTNILRKQFMDFIKTLNELGANLDTQQISKTFTELSGIPNAEKFIRDEQESAPPPPEGQVYLPSGELVPEEEFIRQIEEQIGGQQAPQQPQEQGAPVPQGPPADQENTARGIRQATRAI